jgi:hypothetical protein
MKSSIKEQKPNPSPQNSNEDKIYLLLQQIKPPSIIALRWTPDGRRKEARLKKIWRRTIERVEHGAVWSDFGGQGWWALVETLCVP